MLRCGPIGGLFVATALVIASAAAKAAEGGIFCKGTMFFIERLEPNRAMSLKVMGADERQHIISVEGVAIPHNDGWRYQEKSDSDPDQRCTLDIFPRWRFCNAHDRGRSLRQLWRIRSIFPLGKADIPSVVPSQGIFS
jgi:hypothetical protein